LESDTVEVEGSLVRGARGGRETFRELELSAIERGSQLSG
jgi:hypothetical protein